MSDAFPSELPSFAIRPAQRQDCGLILELIQELADYEHLADQVTASIEDLELHLFGPRPAAEVLIGEEGATPVGFALFFTIFSTFLGRPGIYLEDLFVRPAYRGRGYGKALLLKLARIAVERNCGRLEWAVLDWNRPALDFYRNLGASPLPEWVLHRVTGARLERLAEAAGNSPTGFELT